MSVRRGHVSARNRLDAEVEDIVRALRSYGVLTKERLEEIAGAGYWRTDVSFDAALHDAIAHGRVRQLSPRLYELTEDERSSVPGR